MAPKTYLSQILNTITTRKKEQRIITVIYETNIDNDHIVDCIQSYINTSVIVVEANDKMLNELEKYNSSTGIIIILIKNLDHKLTFDQQYQRICEINQYVQEKHEVQVIIPIKYNGIYQQHSRIMSFIKNSWLVYKT